MPSYTSYSPLGNTIEGSEITNGTIESSDVKDGDLAMADMADDVVDRTYLGSVSGSATSTTYAQIGSDITVAAGDFEAGDLLLFDGIIVTNYGTPSFKIVINDGTNTATLEDAAGNFDPDIYVKGQIAEQKGTATKLIGHMLVNDSQNHGPTDYAVNATMISGWMAAGFTIQVWAKNAAASKQQDLRFSFRKQKGDSS